MMTTEAIRMAWGNLLGHKLRSFLTILGVIIGVGSVLAVATMGKSVEQSVIGQFDTIDERTIYVYSSLTPLSQGPADCMQYCNVWTERDLQALQSLPGVERIVVSAKVDSTSITISGKDLTYDGFTATLPESDDLRNAADYSSGGPFELGEAQVVLGWDVANSFAQNHTVSAGDIALLRFPGGHTVSATVAGVLKKDPTLFGDRNGRIWVPINPFYNLTRLSPTSGEDVTVFNSFTIVVTDPATVNAIRDDAKSYVDQESDARLLKVDKQILFVSTPSDIQQSISNAFGLVTGFIGAIGGVSLLVGAIGIANIMLVSVTERRREIGIMKAIGATKGEIRGLFLIEAILIGLAGATLGIGLGLAAGAGLVNGVFSSQGVSLVVPLEWIGYSVFVGVSVGVVAGFLPARQATKVQPVEALAYE